MEIGVCASGERLTKMGMCPQMRGTTISSGAEQRAREADAVDGESEAAEQAYADARLVAPSSSPREALKAVSATNSPPRPAR